MKKVLFLCLFLCLGTSSFSQTALKVVKVETETVLRKYLIKIYDNDFLITYKPNTLLVKSVKKQSDGSILLKGTIAIYSYSRSSGKRLEPVVSRSIKVTLNEVLDDYEVTDLDINVKKNWGDYKWYWYDVI